MMSKLFGVYFVFSGSYWDSLRIFGMVHSQVNLVVAMKLISNLGSASLGRSRAITEQLQSSFVDRNLRCLTTNSFVQSLTDMFNRFISLDAICSTFDSSFM